MINENMHSPMLLTLFYSVHRSIAWSRPHFSLLPLQLHALGGTDAKRGNESVQDPRQI